MRKRASIDGSAWRQRQDRTRLKPAALYKRCNAAKPRVRSCAGCAHLATRNNRETKPESWTARGDAENGAMTWLKSRGGL